MDMSGMGMSGGMGGMSMGSGVPSLFYMQKMFWAVVGATIACATVVSIFNKCLCRQRLTAASRGRLTPAKPKSLFFTTCATIVAITRELAYASCPTAAFGRFRWSSPTLGRVTLVLAEFVLVIVLCFYKLDPTDQWQWENIGYRTGFISAAQLPLVVLLAGKNNTIGILIGSSYEKLNWLHRWVARILFISVTVHMGFWFTDWARYDYIKVKLSTDVITQRGFAAWCILLWIVLSSFAPIRRWNYEFFVIQHIMTFIGFLAAVYLHLPSEVKVYIWLPIGFYICDRAVRTFFILFNNLSVFHRRFNRDGFWSCKATLEPVSQDTTRIVINNPPIQWRAGQHVFLSCHGISPLQSHPFTIASIPQDGRMEFLVKAKAGSTKRFYTHAEKSQDLPVTTKDLHSLRSISSMIDGPYGRVRALQQFDSVFLIAGSSGGTFTVPLMRDVVASWKSSQSNDAPRPFFRKQKGAATRYIRFIWIIKSRDQYNWFADRLAGVAADVKKLRQDGLNVEIDMSIYITCDINLEADSKPNPQPKHTNPLHSKPTQIPSTTTTTAIEKDPPKEETTSVHSRTLSSPTDQLPPKSCGPNGTCCCTTTIEDEPSLASSAPARQCCCCSTTPPAQPPHSQPDSRNESITSSTASSCPHPEKPPPSHPIDPAITLLTGRPRPKTLIRKTLEHALGESAVVVCGPPGLVDDVRRSVVALSDERAVHKGTGAQGVYLHVEGFEY